MDSDIASTVVQASASSWRAPLCCRSIVALTHWLPCGATAINAFGAWARFVRRWSDPLLRPLERRLVRGGANPQDAPFWLVGIVVVGGLVLIGTRQLAPRLRRCTMYWHSERGYLLAW